jgi:hypothetical protein
MRSARYPFQGVGDLGDLGCPCSMPVVLAGLGDVTSKIDKGELVTLRFRGTGVSRSNQGPALEAIRVAVLATNHFETPSYLGWGDNGTLVYRGKTKSDNYSLREIADFTVGVARRASQRSGKQITFLTTKDNDNNETGPSSTVPGAASGGESTATSEEVRYTTLVGRLGALRRRVGSVFGTTRPPEMSWAAVKSANLTAFVSAPSELVRSAVLYGVGIVAKILASARVMLDGARQNVSGATQDARAQLDAAAAGMSAIETVLSAIPSSATSGLGFFPFVVPIAALYALWRFFSSEGDTDARTAAYCQRKLELTGERCTPQEFADVSRRYAEDEESGGFWDKIGDQVSGTLSSILKYALIGGGVLVGTFVAWQAFVAFTAYRATKAIVSTPEGRRIAAGAAGALVGGPAGAAAAASLVSNRRSKSRRKRTSRNRRK